MIRHKKPTQVSAPKNFALRFSMSVIPLLALYGPAIV